LLYLLLQARCPLKLPLFFIHHPLLFQSTKKLSDSSIKFPSNPSSSKDDLPAHLSSEENISFDDRRSSDYSPLWSSEREDPEEEDEDKEDTDADAEDNNDDSDSNDFDSNFASSPPKRARRASYV